MANEKTTSEKHTIEDVLSKYADRIENGEDGAATVVNRPPHVPSSVYENEVEQTETPTSEFTKKAVQAANSPKKTAAQMHEERMAEIKQEQLDLGRGYQELPIDQLPSAGLFYPDGTRIYVRAASGVDIRYWSMVDETTIESVNEAFNYILERCARISFPESCGKTARWEDILNIDRLYIITAIHDFTFQEGVNDLKIMISETESVVVHKDDIKYVDFDERIMKYYNPTKRCFTFKAKTVDELNFYVPSIGVDNWMQGYYNRKAQRNENFDIQFFRVAPMLISDFRRLSDSEYTKLVQSTMNYSGYEWSLISKVREKIEGAVTPKFIYVKDGVEKETSVVFQGGFKALFTYDLSDEIDL